MRVLITDHSFGDLSEERCVLDAAGIGLSDNRECPDEAGLCALVREADGILSQAARLTGPVIAAARNCRVIVRYGTGFDNIDLEAARQRGIVVSNVPDYCTEDVADHAWMLSLALVRRLPRMVELVRAGSWTSSQVRPVPRIGDLTVGIYGLGRIGRAFARRARAAGCPLIACDPYLPEPDFAEAGVTAMTAENLLAGSDLLSLHAPLTDETRRFLNAGTFPRLKRGAFVVNCGRGALIESEALVAALEAGRLRGAALDVTDPEPLPADHPLLRRPDVIVTGHMAWYSEASVRQLKRSVAEEAVRVLRGEPPRWQVNA